MRGLRDRLRKVRPVVAVCVVLAIINALAAAWMVNEMRAVADAEALVRELRAEVRAIQLEAVSDAHVQIQEESFWAAAEPLAKSVETGHVLALLEKAAATSGVEIQRIEPGETNAKFYHGHLRAASYRVEAEGSGPETEAFAVLCENLAVPGDVREVTTQLGTEDVVRMTMVVVFYSLNPPSDMVPPEPIEDRPDVFTPAIR